MTTFRNIKSVPYYMPGPGSFAGLGDLLDARRTSGGPVFFYLDHFFQNHELAKNLPAKDGDKVFFVDSSAEPTVEAMDALADAGKAVGTKPCCVVGIGGGAVLDSAKAVANLLTNPGKAEEYQGWELVKNPAIYKIGIPTIAGTGAEASRTCVLTNDRKKLKLGMNSDFTMFDQIILDPELTRSVPRRAYFFTGIDTFMHCFESRRGSYRNVIVDALAGAALGLCHDVFLGDKDMMDPENLEKLMVASYLGGMAAGNVGIVHPISAGLGVVLHVPHGLAGCYALSVLGEFYPEEQAQLMAMLKKQGIVLEKGLCKNLSDDQLEALYLGSIVHEKPLINALGPDFKKILTKEKVISLFKQM